MLKLTQKKEKQMSYFPIKIRITEQASSRFGQEIILQTPDELPSGISFKVLETNVSNTWAEIEEKA